MFGILLLFGARRIPELMKGIGKGVRSFKEGMNDITNEINNPTPPASKGDGDKSEADKK